MLAQMLQVSVLQSPPKNTCTLWPHCTKAKVAQNPACQLPRFKVMHQFTTPNNNPTVTTEKRLHNLAPLYKSKSWAKFGLLFPCFKFVQPPYGTISVSLYGNNQTPKLWQVYHMFSMRPCWYCPKDAQKCKTDSMDPQPTPLWDRTLQ